MNSRATRLARGAVVGVFATALAALSHAVAGGGTPSALALGAGAVFGGMLGTFALSARPSLPRLTVAVGVTQLAFHVLFSTLGTSFASAGDHVHGVTQPMAAASPAHAHVDTPLMWFSHAVAGLVTLALLCGAERAAWRVVTEFARLVVSPFRAAAPAPVAVPLRRAPLASRSPVRLVGRLLITAVSRRGPPLSVAI